MIALAGICFDLMSIVCDRLFAAGLDDAGFACWALGVSSIAAVRSFVLALVEMSADM